VGGDCLEIAPDRSDDGYSQTIFDRKKEEVDPKVRRWLPNARESKSPSLKSVKQPDFDYNLREMGSLTFEEKLQDRAPKNMYKERIGQLQQMREDLCRAGVFENVENDFHPRNMTSR
jgi:hypothetical protein